MAKAFDTISIPILLRKLEALGIRGAQLNLFENYLNGIPAVAKDLCMMLFNAVWRDMRPALRMQESPYRPRSSTASPHTHWCGCTILVPKRKQTAIVRDNPSSNVPTLADGKA
ncbi:hypothetical protein ACJJTC_002704 [Scirpophaga incertulas]